MTTHYLKFTDEAQAAQVLAQFRDEKGWVLASPTHALDPVGTVWKPTGVMIQGEMGEFPEMAAIPGWHLNFIGTLPAGAEAFEVFPATPERVFAE